MTERQQQSANSKLCFYTAVSIFLICKLKCYNVNVLKKKKILHMHSSARFALGCLRLFQGSQHEICSRLPSSFSSLLHLFSPHSKNVHIYQIKTYN